MDSDFTHPNALDATLASVFLHGDCTSSFMTCYPEFRDFRSTHDGEAGLIRFASTARSWIAATEPLAGADARAPIMRDFSKLAASEGKSVILMPVSSDFADRARMAGFHSVQVGSEAVFELAGYFSREQDPLQRFPHARSLVKRGAQILELDPVTLSTEHESEILALTRAWKVGRKAQPLGFLNQVDPLHLKEHKKLFAVFLHGKMIAFLSAAPIPARRSYFFADYIRAASSRAGTMELLFVEAMRILAHQGFKEVRLGLCLFARLDAVAATGTREKLLHIPMNLMFRYGKRPFCFRTIYEFKAKFAPSRWDNLHLVSNRKVGLWTLSEVLEIHQGRRPVSGWLSTQRRSLSRLVRPDTKVRPMPTSASEWLRRSALSSSCVVFFLALHALRVLQPQMQAAFAAAGYSPAHPDAAGVFAGPLFHNNIYHLSGDLLSFLFFGSIVEVIKGRGLALLVVALGLWASNPIAHAIVAGFLPVMDPAAWQHFLKELDYGSSNAVYALAGALAAFVTRPGLILAPFVLNGAFLCLSRTSWLSLHHLVGLGLGYACAVAWRRR